MTVLLPTSNLPLGRRAFRASERRATAMAKKTTTGTRRKRFLLAGMILVPVLLGLAALWGLRGCGREEPKPYMRPTGLHRLNSDGPFFVLIYEYPGGIAVSDFPLSQVTTADDTYSIVFSITTEQGAISAQPILLRKELGGAMVFSLEIAAYGVPLPPIEEFRYAGEEYVTIARGPNWFLHITRD